jgi:hypothetical protein
MIVELISMSRENSHHNLNHVIQTRLAILDNRNHGSVITSSPSMDLDGQLAISRVLNRPHCPHTTVVFSRPSITQHFFFIVLHFYFSS